MSTYTLSQQEIRDLMVQSQLISQQEQILIALRMQQQGYLIQNVFPRLSISVEDGNGAKIDIDTGVLTLEPEKKDVKSKGDVSEKK